jgi:hypothetical protein
LPRGGILFFSHFTASKLTSISRGQNDAQNTKAQDQEDIDQKKSLDIGGTE